MTVLFGSNILFWMSHLGTWCYVVAIVKDMALFSMFLFSWFCRYQLGSFGLEFIFLFDIQIEYTYMKCYKWNTILIRKKKKKQVKMPPFSCLCSSCSVAQIDPHLLVDTFRSSCANHEHLVRHYYIASHLTTLHLELLVNYLISTST